jgi:hypothetical protein
MGCKTARLQASPAPEAAPAMEAYSGRPACGPAPCLDAGGMSRPPRAPNDPGRRSNAELKACLDPTLMLAMSGIALRSEERRLVARNCGGNAAPRCLRSTGVRPGDPRPGSSIVSTVSGAIAVGRRRQLGCDLPSKSFKAQSLKPRARGGPARRHATLNLQSRDGEVGSRRHCLL